jgi:hypothetical protein
VVEYNQEYWCHDVLDIHVEVSFARRGAAATKRKAKR